MRRSLIWTVAFLAAQFTTTAFALTSVRPLTTQNETIYVGQVRLSGGLGTYAQVVCFDAAGTANDFYVYVGNVYGLSDDYSVYADPIGGTGGDTFFPIETSATALTGFCATGTNSGSGQWYNSWNRLAYNGHYIDFYGVGGADSVSDGGGTNNTYIAGDDGNDYVAQSSSVGYASGGNGNDYVGGLSSGNYDKIFGDAGSDCLYDSTSTATYYDCGGNAGDTRDSRNSGMSVTGCPSTSACWP